MDEKNPNVNVIYFSHFHSSMQNKARGPTDSSVYKGTLEECKN